MELHFKNKDTREIKGEVFKPYPLNTQYLVSNYGRIKSKQQAVKHNYGGIAIKKERVLTQTDNGSGYLSVGLTENGKTKTTRVSRIVAITFINNPDNKPQVNHINGVKYDNRVVNLEWNTCGENVRHAWNNDLSKKQSSFIYVKERLEKINQYVVLKTRVKTPLGYGTIIIDQNCYRIEYDNGKFENLVKSLRFWKDEFKLVLRNLSDLTKEIEHNGEKFVPIEYFEIGDDDNYIYEFDSGNIKLIQKLKTIAKYNNHFDIKFLPYEVVSTLISWHFDVFNLIPDGLAIDINSMKP